jgi:hypothetical protein
LEEQLKLNCEVLLKVISAVNQDLFQQEEPLQDRRMIQKEWIIPIQNEKALFLHCHIVVLTVKLIY